MAHYGIHAVFIFMSGAMLLMVPVRMFVVDHPAQLGLRAAGASEDLDGLSSAPLLSYGDIARTPSFWAFVTMACVVASAGVAGCDATGCDRSHRCGRLAVVRLAVGSGRKRCNPRHQRCSTGLALDRDDDTAKLCSASAYASA